MTKNVHGAARARAARLTKQHAQNNATSQLEQRKAQAHEPAAPMRSAPIRPSKAQAFAGVAEAAGWSVTKYKKKSDGSKRVLAQRELGGGVEILEMVWSAGNKFRYPGRYSSPSADRHVRNASEGKRILEATVEQAMAQQRAQSSKRKTTRRSVATKHREEAEPLQAELAELDDEQLIATVSGHSVTWINPISEVLEEGTILNNNVHTRITSDDQGRTLHFCDKRVGFRSVRVERITSIG